MAKTKKQDFEAYFYGYSTFFEEHGERKRCYWGFAKNSVIKMVKKDADEMYADEFNIYRKSRNSDIFVGSWEKKGDKWYKI